MKILIAIDPGKSGGIAYSLGTTCVSAIPMPETDGDVLEHLQAIIAEANGETVRAVIEEVGGFMGEDQPASSAFNFGYRHGLCVGLLQASKVKIEFVRPQKWQKIFSLGKSGRRHAPPGASEAERKEVQRQNARLKTEWKNKLKETAQQLFPGLKITLSTADALLLVEYGRRAYGFYQ